MVAFVGLSAVALKTSNAIWMSVFANFLVGLLCFASVASIILRQSENRAFWTGFAVFGWVFIIMHGYVGSFLLGATSPVAILMETYGKQIGDIQQRYHCDQIAKSIVVLLLSIFGGLAGNRLYRFSRENQN